MDKKVEDLRGRNKTSLGVDLSSPNALFLKRAWGGIKLASLGGIMVIKIAMFNEGL